MPNAKEHGELSVEGMKRMKRREESWRVAAACWPSEGINVFELEKSAEANLFLLAE